MIGFERKRVRALGRQALSTDEINLFLLKFSKHAVSVTFRSDEGSLQRLHP